MTRTLSQAAQYHIEQRFLNSLFRPSNKISDLYISLVSELTGQSVDIVTRAHGMVFKSSLVLNQIFSQVHRMPQVDLQSFRVEDPMDVDTIYADLTNFISDYSGLSLEDSEIQLNCALGSYDIVGLIKSQMIRNIDKIIGVEDAPIPFPWEVAK